MTVLVTGASGFVGSAVARKLLGRGKRLRLLVRPTSSWRNLANLEAEVVEGDLGRPETLAAALSGCEALYHVAADYRLWTRDPEALIRTNVDGTRALMCAALDAGVERIVYTSSVAVLKAFVDGTPADEDTPVSIADMIGPYKRSKFLAEEVVRDMVREQNLPCVIVNPSTPVGPRDVRPTPTGRMIVVAASGRMPAFVDTGLNVAHVDDVAEGHLLAFEKGRVGERYILGGENMALADILAIVAEAAGGRPARLRLPVPPLMPIACAAEAWAWFTRSDKEPFVTRDALRMAKKKMFFESDKAKRELGYAPRPARKAIIDAVKWFREEGYV